MNRVYPKLRDFCHEHGYEFQVMDMRLGVHDPCTDDHMISEISLNELKTCQELSTGPNFVVSNTFILLVVTYIYMYLVKSYIPF